MSIVIFNRGIQRNEESINETKVASDSTYDQ